MAHLHHLNHFQKLYEVGSTVAIKSSKTVDSIGAFLKKLDKDKHDETISNLFELSIDNLPLDGDIFEIKNPREDKVFFKFVQKPHMHAIPKSTVAAVASAPVKKP